MNYNEEALLLHEKFQGKLEVVSKSKVESKEDLSTIYTPGVAAVSKAVSEDTSLAYTHTLKGRTIAVFSDGTAVLGLGDIGPEGALPVMEGKAVLFKEMAGVDAFPICIAEKDTEEIIKIVKALSPTFGGINLEDISAPRCFEIERRLKEELTIPVFHDDQWGTAVVVLAGLINASKIAKKDLKDCKVIINGAGAAGTAIAKVLLAFGVTDIVTCDSKGAIFTDRGDLNDAKVELASLTNKDNVSGSLSEVIHGADIFLGVSVADALSSDDISNMNADPIVFAMANPTPEIMPEEAYKGGAAVVATGRSDFPNQVNNALVFPGIFKGALKYQVQQITIEHLIKAADLLAGMIENPHKEQILPDVLNKEVADVIAQAFA